VSPPKKIVAHVEANLKIIEELRLFITLILQEPSVLAKFSTAPQSFIRTRKLPFDRVVLLIAKLCKKTLSVEIEKFFEEIATQYLQRECFLHSSG